MNKSTIGLYLLGIALIFIGAFFLGRHSKESKVKGDGGIEKVLYSRIDSLQNLQAKSDTVILRIKDTKIKLHEVYIHDTTYINSLPFDSLKVLFLQQYPR